VRRLATREARNKTRNDVVRRWGASRISRSRGLTSDSAEHIEMSSPPRAKLALVIRKSYRTDKLSQLYLMGWVA
jgi:hypothetical protein